MSTRVSHKSRIQVKIHIYIFESTIKFLSIGYIQNRLSDRNLHFFAGSKYLLLDLKASSKTYKPGSKNWRPKKVLLPLNLEFYTFLTKQSSIRSKELIMPLTL